MKHELSSLERMKFFREWVALTKSGRDERGQHNRMRLRLQAHGAQAAAWTLSAAASAARAVCAKMCLQVAGESFKGS
jgi:hypothetical protein